MIQLLSVSDQDGVGAVSSPSEIRLLQILASQDLSLQDESPLPKTQDPLHVWDPVRLQAMIFLHLMTRLQDMMIFPRNPLSSMLANLQLVELISDFHPPSPLESEVTMVTLVGSLAACPKDCHSRTSSPNFKESGPGCEALKPILLSVESGNFMRFSFLSLSLLGIRTLVHYSDISVYAILTPLFCSRNFRRS